MLDANRGWSRHKQKPNHGDKSKDSEVCPIKCKFIKVQPLVLYFRGCSSMQCFSTMKPCRIRNWGRKEMSSLDSAISGDTWHFSVYFPANVHAHSSAWWWMILVTSHINISIISIYLLTKASLYMSTASWTISQSDMSYFLLLMQSGNSYKVLDSHQNEPFLGWVKNKDMFLQTEA